MFIYCFQYFFIHCERITPAKIIDPRFLKHILIVGNYLSPDIRIILWTFLQQFTIHCINGIVLNRYHRRITLKNLLIHKGIITRLKKALLHTDTNDGIGIERAAQGLR